MKQIAPIHYKEVIAKHSFTSGILILLLLTFILSKTSYSQPVITPTLTNATCGQNNGSISVAISGCSPPNIYVQQFIGTSPGSTINLTPYSPGQIPVVINNLPIGSYYCIFVICG